MNTYTLSNLLQISISLFVS